MCRPSRLSGVLAACLLASGLAFCQSVGDYAFVHPFGLASATTTRQFGMGASISCLSDLGSGNPAFAALYKAPNAGVRLSTTDFDFGPELTTVHLSVVQPLEPGLSGLQISLLSLRSSDGLTFMPGLGPVVFELSEEDVAIHYGRKLGPRLSAGVGLSPYSEIKFAVGVPGGPTLLKVSAKPDLGARLGLAYEYDPGDFVGLVYDYYQETATATGAGLGLPPGGAVETVFHTDLFALGASRHLRPDVVGVLEYRHGASYAGPMEGTLSTWHVGAEWQATENWSVRAGAADKRPTLGFGYSDGQWQVDYAYLSRWNDDIAAGVFGGSDTHQLQGIYRW